MHIWDRPRGAVLASKRNCCDDVEKDHGQKKNTCGPKQLRSRLKKIAVTVQRLRTKKDLQVSEEVCDDEADQHKSRESHDILLPEGRVPCSGEHIHGCRTLPIAVEGRQRVRQRYKGWRDADKSRLFVKWKLGSLSYDRLHPGIASAHDVFRLTVAHMQNLARRQLE